MLEREKAKKKIEQTLPFGVMIDVDAAQEEPEVVRAGEFVKSSFDTALEKLRKAIEKWAKSVSYTHLDVYKRQLMALLPQLTPELYHSRMHAIEDNYQRALLGVHQWDMIERAIDEGIAKKHANPTPQIASAPIITAPIAVSYTHLCSISWGLLHRGI